MSELGAPAQTYKLNVLASATGRFASPDISDATSWEASELFDRAVDDLLRDDVPPVPHFDTELLCQASAFDDKLMFQLVSGPAAEHLRPTQIRQALQLLGEHRGFCERYRDTPGGEMLIDPQAIADAYGTPGLWQDPARIIDEEVARYGHATQHPVVPPALERLVTVPETRQLLNFMWRRVIGVQPPADVNVYLTERPADYHVFWSPGAEGLDYATPATYDRATQLSFDLPHNATHLAHLAALDSGQGTARYDDSMAQRAYFEALTVFSEIKVLEAAQTDPNFGAELADIMRIPPAELSAAALAEWVAADRAYEAKLRAARYYADNLMIAGMPYADAVPEIAREFGIPQTHAAAETAKYLPWTGLGGVYTYGYRQLEALDAQNVRDALFDHRGRVVQTWQQRRDAIPAVPSSTYAE